MTARADYPPGVPCWVETLQPSPRDAARFYNRLFGWDAAGPGAMPDGGEYYVARLHGDDVAGIATQSAAGGADAVWTTYVRVDDLETYAQRVRERDGLVLVAPLDAHPAGRFAIVAAPTGSVFGLWEPRDRSGAQRVNEPGAWAMSALITRNLDAAVRFYCAVFGWNAEPFETIGAKGVLLRLPGYVGGRPQQAVPRDVVAVALEDAGAGQERWSVDFWIDDVDAAIETIERNGGTVLQPQFDVAVFRRAVAADPAGATFSISQIVPERIAAESVARS